jgi:hypothetical protein
MNTFTPLIRDSVEKALLFSACFSAICDAALPLFVVELGLGEPSLKRQAN